MGASSRGYYTFVKLTLPLTFMASREIYTSSSVNGSVLVFPDLKLGIMFSSDMLLCFIQFLLEVNIMGGRVQPS